MNKAVLYVIQVLLFFNLSYFFLFLIGMVLEKFCAWLKLGTIMRTKICDQPKWNLLTGRHGNVTWKRCRDVLIGGHGNVIQRPTTVTSLGRRYNFLVQHHGDVPLRRLGDVPPRCPWVFQLRRTCDGVGTDEKTLCEISIKNCCWRARYQ